MSLPLNASIWDIIGTVAAAGGGLAGGAIGLWVTYRVRGRSPEQRAFLRRFYAWLAPSTLVFIAVIALTDSRLLPIWAGATAMAIWVAALPIVSIWFYRRLDSLGPPPFVTRELQRAGMAQIPLDQRRYLARWCGTFGGAHFVFVAAIVLVVWRVWPLWTLWLSIPIYLTTVFGMVFRLLRKFRVGDRLRIAWRMLARATRR
jgi:hypothetical protein